MRRLNAAGRDRLRGLMGRNGTYEAIFLHRYGPASSIEELVSSRAATGAEFQAKFLQEGAGLLSYGGLNMFFGGLSKVVGDPHPIPGWPRRWNTSIRNAATRSRRSPPATVRPAVPT